MESNAGNVLARANLHHRDAFTVFIYIWSKTKFENLLWGMIKIQKFKCFFDVKVKINE